MSSSSAYHMLIVTAIIVFITLCSTVIQNFLVKKDADVVIPIISRYILPLLSRFVVFYVSHTTASSPERPILSISTCHEVAFLNLMDVEYEATRHALGSLNYISVADDYWSERCASMKPSCVMRPSTALGVSIIVEVLSTNNESFAIRSGGHSANIGFSSISGGPLICLRKLNRMSYNTADNTVSIGPGRRWGDVLRYLEPYNVTVVGGRMGEVGVGGFLSGGGLSFLSSQYGWAASNLIEVELVLPNGTVARASSEINSDLFAAIKGGGNSFGIITDYVLATKPIQSVWGGYLTFLGGTHTDAMLEAIETFAANYAAYSKAAIVPTAQLLSGRFLMWTIIVFYDGPSPPPGVFDNFMELKPAINSTKTQSYASLVEKLNMFVIHNSRYGLATETIPLPSLYEAPSALRAYYDIWYSATQQAKDATGLVSSIAFQPLPKSIASSSWERGTDVLALDDSVDRIILQFHMSYWLAVDDARIDDATAAMSTDSRSLTLNSTMDGKLPAVYLPLFMNDASRTQDYWGRVRAERRESAHILANQIDPNGLFRHRTGGFKI